MLNFFNADSWKNPEINPVSIDLDDAQQISSEVKNIEGTNLNIKSFDVVMTSTEFDYFDDLCSDLAGNHVVDFNGVIHSHLLPQLDTEDIPEEINAVNFHIEVIDDFTEEVFLEFDTNLPEL